MTLTLINAQDIPPQAWRNGGGVTRELLTWPGSADWRVRISRADIAADGPFSAFPDVQRWFTVLEGDGVALQFHDGEHVLRPGDAPIAFDGAKAPGCRLLNGATQDLNLMIRQGNGVMQPVQADAGWRVPFAARGLYTLDAGQWQGGGRTHPLITHSLLWCDDGDASEWTFVPAHTVQPLRAWWLGFTPDER